jgi:hypothetical protein
MTAVSCFAKTFAALKGMTDSDSVLYMWVQEPVPFKISDILFSFNNNTEKF